MKKLLSRLRASCEKKDTLKVRGTWGSFAPMLASCISKNLKKPILYIRTHIDDADRAYDDLLTFDAKNVEPLPAWEGEEEIADATDEIRAARLKLTLKILNSPNKILIPSSIQAICQPVPNEKSIRNNCLQLAVNKDIPPEETCAWLVDNAFENVEKIDLPGQFARRGGIIDIFAPVTSGLKFIDNNISTDADQAQAFRVEFFGDTIESIRTINLDTLRSAGQIEKIGIVSALCGTDKNNRQLLTDILPEDTIIILEEPAEIEEAANLYTSRLETSKQIYTWPQIHDSLQKFTRLHISRFASDDDDYISLDIKSTQRYQHRAIDTWQSNKAAIEQLVNEAGNGKKILLYCESTAEIERVTEIINKETGRIPANMKLIKGFINQGFVIGSLNTIIISHHELFGQFSVRRLPRPGKAAAPIDTLEELNPGDYVVHASYGIGKFLGIETIKQDQLTKEYLTIEYADSEKIHVLTDNIHLVQKYIGTSPKRPKLSKTGSKKWQRQKEKVARSVRDLAAELLDIQANRQLAGGIACPEDSNWQREFEESFPYQETEDQTRAAQEIKADMQQPIAMDRLLCGDVGYGKTELAMRAAFKTVENSRQVALLVPTTVLCVQHGRTFTERFADFPVCIEILNRFKTTKQAADIIKRTKEGKVDVLIGTHRLLTGDVKFKDLGLVIIDEEQRFGVRHKEKLKKMRYNVDILTMTATPIPRTLHMSLLGLRDISSLATPPLDRRSVVTNVTAYRDELIRKSILRELGRSGQVFFLHNRVKTIDKKARETSKLLEGTKANIAVAHGRMHKAQLEKTMIDFVRGKIDVLVCTTIIESGLDIPNANTIIIDNADRFGLAELHQLRGRVGRYKHRAFAYMLTPKKRTITPIAARRLKAIEDYSHLGAGFRIALRDLEIRGAGNILGPQQSGHIQMVGYQMYCQLLAIAVRKLKNLPTEKTISANINLPVPAYIPKNYIASDRLRMELYRKIAVVNSLPQVKDIRNGLDDMYGPVPGEVDTLLELAQFRIAAANAGIKAVTTSGQKLIFAFADEITSKQKKMFDNLKVTPGAIDKKTISLNLSKQYFEPQTLMTVTRKIFHITDKTIKEKNYVRQNS